MQHLLRQLENRIARAARDPRAVDVLESTPAGWSLERLRGHHFCLLVTWRGDGRRAVTPMWFAPAPPDRIVARSGAMDPKLKRITREPKVMIAACDIRGRPLGPPMEGHARILLHDEERGAEAFLQGALGWERRVYNVLRAPLLPMAYLEIRA